MVWSGHRLVEARVATSGLPAGRRAEPTGSRLLVWPVVLGVSLLALTGLVGVPARSARRSVEPGTSAGSTVRPASAVRSSPPTSAGDGSPVVGIDARPDGSGYWLAEAQGAVSPFGSASNEGSLGSAEVGTGIVGMAATPDGGGYWLAGRNGGVFAMGDAAFLGSAGALPLNRPIVGMAATPDGRGYWLVASDGGIFAFGDAGFFGSTGSMVLNRPIVGMASTPVGKGYWMVASDGGIFAFGDAGFFGSMGGRPLNAPIAGMAASGDGSGYWMVGSDGGMFSFGAARFFGSLLSAGPSPVPGPVPPATVTPAPVSQSSSPPAIGNPSSNLPPAPNFLDACYPHNTGSTCISEAIQATDAARSAEGLGPLHLPTDFVALTPAEQLFVLVDVERVDRGLPPVVGLDATLDAEAAAGAEANADPQASPMPAGMSLVAWASNWAENGNPLGSNYFWMYDDGPGSSNVDCTATDTAGCWGHRDNILGLTAYQAEYGGTLLMGAAEAVPSADQGWASDTELIVLATGPQPAYVYTWAQAVAAGAS